MSERVVSYLGCVAISWAGYLPGVYVLPELDFGEHQFACYLLTAFNQTIEHQCLF